VPLPIDREEAPAEGPVEDGRVVTTGFPALDAILGPGGIPRVASVSLRGDHSSGKTTLALRLAAEAQAGGAIVAWLDLARAFDPVEAVARGVRLEWLVVLTPADANEGLAMAGALLQGRAVDLLLIDLHLMDLPLDLRQERPDPARRGGRRAPGLADRIHRLAALARRSGTLLVVLEPPGLAQGIAGALGESVGLRLDLARRAWLRLGRDVVGQQTEVVVDRNHFGPPGRRADLRIVYAEGGDRDACLAVPHLLRETPPDVPAHRSGRRAPATPEPQLPLGGSTPHKYPASLHPPRVLRDETPPPALAPPAAAAHPHPMGNPPPRPLHALLGSVPSRPDRPGRPTLDRRHRAGPQPGRGRDGDPARDAARQRAPAGAGSGLPRP
jgi:recombination protein RecA